MIQILQDGIDHLTGLAAHALKDLGVVRGAAKYRKRDGWLPSNEDARRGGPKKTAPSLPASRRPSISA